MKKSISLILIFIIVSFQSYADSIKLKMPNGLNANAAYTRGEPNKPAIFILHGFLQTHHFSTVSRLYENLSAEGYTVFSPTITLGIPNRKKSLACEALHDHTMENSQAEIDVWLKWLKKKGHENIVVMGHSQGSTSLLSYISKNDSERVSKFIAVSILEVNTSREKDENLKFNKFLNEKLKNKERIPFSRKLSFCDKYFGTPRSFISYQAWSEEKIIQTLATLKTPTKIIMGGNDNRISKDWNKKLKSKINGIAIIKGANHFMDGVHEFDLLDIILGELKNSR